MNNRILAMIVLCAFVCTLIPSAVFAAAITQDPFNWDVPALDETKDAARKERMMTDVDEAYDLNILLIGCSFGSDVMTYTPEFLKGLYPDLKFNIGRIFRGSTPIKDHYDFSQSEKEVYAYIEHYYNGDGGSIGKSTLFSTSTSPSYLCNVQLAIDRADWDIVILQTTSGYCAIDGSYATDEINYVSALREYVANRLKANNPDSNPEFFWNMVWTHPSFSENAKFELFDKNMLKMYKGIIDNVQEDVVAADTGIDYVIPNGTAIMNAFGGGIEDKFLFRDNEHLSDGNTMKKYLGSSYTGDGMYAAGATTAATLALYSDKIMQISGKGDYNIAAAEDKNAVIDAAADAAMTGYAANVYPDHKTIINTAVKDALKYPFMSLSNTASQINNGRYTFETAQLTGKSEAEVKALIADTILSTTDAGYTGAQITADDITLVGYSTELADANTEQAFSFDVALEDGTAVSGVPAYSENMVNLAVSASFGNGAQVPVESRLIFTFNLPMQEDLLTPENIVLKEEVKGGTAYNVRSYDDYEYNPDSQTYTISFGEGDLAANTKYSVTFTTALKTAEDDAFAAEKTFFFTTVGDKWYINDNFSRYPTDVPLSVNNTSNTQLLPMQYALRAGSNVHAAVFTKGTDGRNAFTVKAYSTSSASPAAYTSAGYRMDYMPEETYTKIKKCEVEFDFGGDDSAVYGVYTNLLTIAQLADGKYYLCGRYDGLGNIIDNDTKANYYKNKLTPICEISEYDESNPIVHKLSFDMYSEYKSSSSYQRRLYNMYLDGKKITRVVDSAGVTESGASYTDFPENGIKLSSYIDGSGNTANVDMNYCATEDSMRGRKMFTTWIDTTQAGEDKKEAMLRVYSVKYGKCPAAESNIYDGQRGVYCDSDVILEFPTALSDNNDYSLITVTATENGMDVPFEYALDGSTVVLSFDKSVYTDYRVDIPSYKTADGLPLDTASIGFKTESFGFVHTDNGSSYDGQSISADKTFSLYDRAKAEGIECKLLFAVYDNGELLDLQIHDATTTAASDTCDISVKYAAQHAAEGEVTWRAFVLDSMGNLMPLTMSKGGKIE